MKKKRFIEVKWNGKRVKVEFKDVSWVVTPLDEQYLSKDEKYEIIKAVLNYAGKKFFS